jgi:hypothetical protein
MDCSWSLAFSKNWISVGDRLKKATSDPEIKALRRRSIAMAPNGMKS